MKRRCGFGQPSCCSEVTSGSKETAMKRGKKPIPLSVQAAMKYGIIHSGTSVFDYGEGQGEMCRALWKQGVACDGWDPGHSAHKPKKRADVVTMNFVLNVICDPGLRDHALREAYSLARKRLVIGMRPMGDGDTTKTKRPCGDGWLVKKSGAWTFQKFHTPEAVQAYVRRVLDRRARVIQRDPVVVVVEK